MNRKRSSLGAAGAISLVAALIVASAAAQSIINTVVFTPPGVANNIGFDFEVAVVESTGLVYVGATGAYGNEVGVINPTTDSLVATIPVPTSGAMNFALVNQTTDLVYFRQPNANIVVIDGRSASATLNQALSSVTFPGRQIQSFDLDESRGLMYVTNNTIPGPPQSRVSIIDADPTSATFHQVLNDILLPGGALARGVAVNSTTNKVYLGVQFGPFGGVYILDGTTLSLTRITGTPGSFGVAVNENENLVYATAQGNQLNAVDGATDTVLTVIPLPGLITPAAFDEKLAIHTGTGRVYAQTSDALTPGKVVVIDGERLSPTFNTILAAIDVGRQPGSGDVVVDESLNRIVTVSFLDKRTFIIDGATNTVMVTIPSAQIPSDVALDPITHRAFVANQENFVQELNVSTTSLEATIVTGAEAGPGVVNPNNHLFYVGRTIATTDVLFVDKSGASSTVAGLPHGSGRYVFLARNATSNRIYALNTAANLTGELLLPGFVSVIDGASNSVIANVEAGNQPFDLGVNEATNKIYVSNANLGAEFPGSITVIDGNTNTAVTADTSAFPLTTRFSIDIVANETTNRIYFQVLAGAPTTIGVLDGATNVATQLPASLGPVSGIRVNKVLNRVYVVSNGTGSLHVLDGSNDSETATLSFGSPSQTGLSGNNIAVNQNTGQVFVANSEDDTVTVIDGASNTIAATILVGDRPTVVAVNELTNRIYVGSINDKTVSFIDGQSLVVEATLQLPLQPTFLAADPTASRLYVSSGGGQDQSGVVVISDPQLTALGPANVWIGLKNSDDVGTKFDLLAEVFKNNVLVGSGQLNGVSGGSSGFNNAVLRTINLSLSSAASVSPGDTLSFKLSVRIAVGVSGHRSGRARLWFNDAAANSRFDATIDGVTSDYFLLNAFALGNTAGPGPKKTIDVLVDRAAGGNPFKAFGTWTKTL